VVVEVNSSFSSPQEMMVRVKNVDRKRGNIFFIFPSIYLVEDKSIYTKNWLNIQEFGVLCR
jgi:hypothetical protein